MTAPFDPLAILRILLRHGVEFIVIGGLAGRAWGSPTITNDLDVCYNRSNENLGRLVAALRELNVTLRGVRERVPFILDEKTFKLGDSFTFETIAGNLDCLGTPSGTSGYHDLRVNAEEIDLGEGLRVWFTSLDDLIRMKRASRRRKDLIELEILEAVLDERRKKT